MVIMTAEYTISELAKEFAITTRTIRFYEDKGMLSPMRRGLKRIYSPRDRTRLKLILRGKRIGLSLQESQQIIDLYQEETDSKTQLNTLLQTVSNQRALLDLKKSALDAMEAELDEVEAKCREALKQSLPP